MHLFRSHAPYKGIPMNPRNELLNIIRPCVIVAFPLLAYDLWEIATGTIDLNQNQHVPLLFPFTLLALAGMILYTHQLQRNVSVP